MRLLFWKKPIVEAAVVPEAKNSGDVPVPVSVEAVKPPKASKPVPQPKRDRVETLIEQLTNPSMDSTAAIRLGECKGDLRAVEALKQVLATRSTNVYLSPGIAPAIVLNAIRSLAKSGDSSAIAELTFFTRSRNQPVSLLARDAIAVLNGGMTIEQFVKPVQPTSVPVPPPVPAATSDAPQPRRTILGRRLPAMLKRH